MRNTFSLMAEYTSNNILKLFLKTSPVFPLQYFLLAGQHTAQYSSLNSRVSYRAPYRQLWSGLASHLSLTNTYYLFVNLWCTFSGLLERQQQPKQDNTHDPRWLHGSVSSLSQRAGAAHTPNRYAHIKTTATPNVPLFPFFPFEKVPFHFIFRCCVCGKGGIMTLNQHTVYLQAW
jgi:hypothetical protein